jgi:hypothetical protein
MNDMTYRKNTQDSWSSMLDNVRHMTDKLGMPVDHGIVETVAAMRLLKIRTTMSCEGHLDRQTGGPYVMCVSSIAEKLRKKAAVIHNPVDPLYKALYKKAMRANLTEQQKLYQLLEGFYKARNTPFPQRLIVRTMGFSAFRLECQGADMAYVLDESGRKKLLIENQVEMTAFTEYMKDV